MGRVLLALVSTLFLVTQVMAGAWTSNNFLYKPAIGARGEDEKANFDSGLNRVDSRLANEKWLNDAPYIGDLATAVTNIGSAKTVLSIPAGNWPIAANLTVPANLTLKLAHGALLTIATGKTMTINGTLDTGRYQIFSCTGTGKVVFGPGAVTMACPEWFGAVGDDATICTAALNSLSSSLATYGGVVALGTGIYKTDGIWSITPNMTLSGRGREVTAIHNTNNSVYAIEYLSALAGNRDEDASLIIENMRINSKYGIRLNQSGDYASVFSRQAIIKKPIFRHLTIKGTYLAAEDPNYDSAVAPTTSELIGYGVGIALAKVFGASIEDCQISTCGLGMYGDGCDVNDIHRNRIWDCGRWVSLYQHNLYCQKNKIQFNDLLGNRRIGGIYLDGNYFTSIRDNYFETYTNSAQYIKTTGDYQTLVDGNSFDNTTVTTPFVSIDPLGGVIWRNNRYNPSTPTPAFEVLHTNWATNNPILVSLIGNDYRMPMPTSAQIKTDIWDPYLFSYQNPQPLTGLGVASWPWITSPVTGKTTLRTDLGTVIVGFSPKGQRFETENLLIEIKGRTLTPLTPLSSATILWNSTNVYLASLGLTQGFEAETVRRTVKRPLLAAGTTDSLTIELANTYMEIEEIRITPVDYQLLAATPSTGTWKAGEKWLALAPAAGTAPGGFCVTSGTFSGYTDSTGDANGSTNTITGLTSTTGLVVGEYVTLSAGFPTTGPYQVIEITSATAIKVNANSNAVSSNITVSTPNPVFKAMATIAP